MSARVFAIGLAALAAAALVASASGAVQGGARPAIDLSSRAAVVSYLRSAGIDAKGVVIQRGQRNYAGPNCPGRGWSCTTAGRVVQVAAVGPNVFECTPSPLGGAVPPDTCVVVQDSTGTGADNSARCVERTIAPSPVAQQCSITQTSKTGDNAAFVEQRIQQTAGQSQTAAQSADVTQTTDSGDNRIHLRQSVTQAATTTDNLVAQFQDSQQTYRLSQKSTSGSNDSNSGQTLRQDQSAVNATDGKQSQSGKLEGFVDQLSAGLSRTSNGQQEEQSQKAKFNFVGTQTQVGPMRCCSTQGTNPADTFGIDQNAIQRASSAAAVQTEEVEALCSTTGLCTATQRVKQDAVTTLNSCTDSFCDIFIVCDGEGCFAGSGGGDEESRPSARAARATAQAVRTASLR